MLKAAFFEISPHCDQATCLPMSEWTKQTVVYTYKECYSSCNNLSEISIPEGSKTKFEKLLALYKDKLVEQEQMAKKGM